MIIFLKDEDEFIKRYSQVFDEKLIDMLVSTSDEDWSDIESKGIMFKSGKIIAINYISEEEQNIQKELKNKDKDFIHTSLKDYVDNKLVWLNKRYRIRIDELEDSLYRCAIWNKGRKSDRKPSLILKNGTVTFDGSGGNHYYTFLKSEYKYVINLNILGVDDSLGELLVYKNDTLIEEEKFLKSSDESRGRLGREYKTVTLEDIRIKMNEPWNHFDDMSIEENINPFKKKQKEKENLDKLRNNSKKKK